MPKQSWGDHTPETIQNLITEMEGVLRDFAGIRDALRALKIDQITIAGQTELVRGLDGWRTWAANGEAAIGEKRKSLGHLGVHANGKSDDPPAREAPKKKRSSK